MVLGAADDAGMTLERVDARARLQNLCEEDRPDVENINARLLKSIL
jgi:hypothetical protein